MAKLFVDAVITTGKTPDGFAIMLSVTNSSGEPVVGLTQGEITVDTLAGNVNLSEAATHFLTPKPGFYVLVVTTPAPLEANSSHVVSIVIAHSIPAGGTDNGQAIAAVRI